MTVFKQVDGGPVLVAAGGPLVVDAAVGPMLVANLVFFPAGGPVLVAAGGGTVVLAAGGEVWRWEKHKKGGLNCVLKNFFVPYVEELFSSSESEVIQSLSEFRVVCSG